MSPPRFVGTSRRRSRSSESTSTTPRARSRLLSPSPTRAADGADLPGILRRRRRSAAPDRGVSRRPRQRPRVAFSPSKDFVPRRPRSQARATVGAPSSQSTRGMAREHGRGVLAGILQWVRSLFQRSPGLHGGLSQPATMDSRQRPVSSPGSPEHGACMPRARGVFPPLSLGALAGASVPRTGSRLGVNGGGLATPTVVERQWDNRRNRRSSGSTRRACTDPRRTWRCPPHVDGWSPSQALRRGRRQLPRPYLSCLIGRAGVPAWTAWTTTHSGPAPLRRLHSPTGFGRSRARSILRPKR